jgi:hypothetical protein
MSDALRQPRILLALLGSCAALCLGLMGPAYAKASTDPYCNPVTLGGYGYCNGTPRNMYQAYGWGDQHSVCVGAGGQSTIRCSSGPGAGVYSATIPWGLYVPTITNNAGGTNTVHGITLS